MTRLVAKQVTAFVVALCASASCPVLAQEAGSSPEDAQPVRDDPEALASPQNAPDGGDSRDSRIDAAREHLERGEELYVSEDWDGALAEFQRAHELLEGHPSQYLVTYNLGRCHEHLFQYGRAMAFYRRYLQEAAPDAADRAEVQAKVDLFQQLLATVYLDVSVPEYEVWVDQRRIGAGLIEVMVPGGSHLIEVRAEGYVAAQQDVLITAQAERTLVFVLERLAEEYRGLSSGYFWASSALAVATLAVGVVVGIMVVSESERLSQQAEDPVAGLTLTQEDFDNVDDLALTADLLYGAAGLFAVAAVVLAFLTDWDGDGGEASGDEGEGARSSTIRFVASGGPGHATLGLRGAF